MEIIWRPKRYSDIPKELLREKLNRDAEYEIAVRNLYATFPKDQATIEKKKLWDIYVDWAKASGIYEQVTLEQQLSEAENVLNAQLLAVNEIRIELQLKSKDPIEIV